MSARSYQRCDIIWGRMSPFVPYHGGQPPLRDECKLVQPIQAIAVGSGASGLAVQAATFGLANKALAKGRRGATPFLRRRRHAE